MRAMGFEIRPFDALPVPFPAPPVFQTCNNFNRVYIHHVGNIQDYGKGKPKPVAPVLGYFGRRNRPSFANLDEGRIIFMRESYCIALGHSPAFVRPSHSHRSGIG